MKLSGVAMMACAFAASTSAMYLEARDPDLDSRDAMPWLEERGPGNAITVSNSIPRTVTCVGSGYKYTSSAIQNSIEAGMDHVNAKTTIGKGKYPHIYHGTDKGVSFPACLNAKDRYEYPAKRGSTFDGDDPETDRVIFEHDGKNKAKYCGVITHSKAPTRGGFVMCK